ncbi:(2Fe-2S)-binding protein [Streptomyces sp. PT12]|uniref:(2Fe-2S)-binding protein n=1 Tax=Streptomyces sp. PT12 TaxID=1510197 RepID=UPI000DE1CC52|nr:(2Fe-2S)-binding protein [Streptomyces sp. PT12]RBM21438.1 (2Fe-2S)-binding protein [Streptomyces sp. PT12]
MNDDQQSEENAQGPRPGWGGEYDAEATAFIELPGGYSQEPGGEPLAAPGHGYQPPEIGGPAAQPATADPTTDPGSTGQWTMPFSWGEPDAAGEQQGAARGPSRAAAMGQGAAALAGGRRRLGEGPAGAEAPQLHETSPWPPERQAAAEQPPPSAWAAPAAGEPHPAESVPGPASPTPPEPTAAEPADGGGRSEHPEVSYVLRVNGVDRPVSGAWIGESLLYVLRERLGLAGAKDGCAQGECGACSVQVDGRLVAACLVPAATAAGSEIRTVEGLSADGTPSDVQRALAASTVQCGFCLPGMAMTVHDLLEGNHTPTDLETRQALCGNLCRCSGYRGVLNAVRAVVEERAARAEAPHDEDRQARIPHQAGPPAGGM